MTTPPSRYDPSYIYNNNNNKTKRGRGALPYIFYLKAISRIKILLRAIINNGIKKKALIRFDERTRRIIPNLMN